MILGSNRKFWSAGIRNSGDCLSKRYLLFSPLCNLSLIRFKTPPGPWRCVFDKNKRGNTYMAASHKWRPNIYVNDNSDPSDYLKAKMSGYYACVDIINDLEDRKLLVLCAHNSFCRKKKTTIFLSFWASNIFSSNISTTTPCDSDEGIVLWSTEKDIYSSYILDKHEYMSR